MKPHSILGSVLLGLTVVMSITAAAEGVACKSATAFESIKKDFMRMYNSTTREPLANFVSRPHSKFFNQIVIFERPTVPDVYAYDVIDDEHATKSRPPQAWRSAMITAHEKVLDLTQESVAGRYVQENVKTLIAMLDKPVYDPKAAHEKIPDPDRNLSTNDLVDRALGAIGSPLAAQPLMDAISKDIEFNKKAPDFEHTRRSHFWGVGSLGHLKFKKEDEELRLKVEDYLIQLQENYYHDFEHSAAYQGVDGLAGDSFNTPRVRKYLLSILGKYSFQEDWAVIRVLEGWQDPTILHELLPVLESTKMDNMSSEKLLGLFASFVDQFDQIGLDRDEAFGRLARAWRLNRYEFSEYTAIAFAYIMPKACAVPSQPL